MRRALAIALSIGLVSTPALAQTRAPEQVRHEFEEAVALEKKGEYAEALERFRRIEAVKVTPGVRFHEAYCLEMLGKLAAAFDAYEDAEKLAREQNKPEVLTAVRGRLEPLGQRVPLINVTAEPKDAEIRVDGQVVTNMSVRVDSGDHDVVASAPGRTTKRLRLTLREGQVQSVALLLEPSPPETNARTPGTAPAPAPATEPPREEPRSGSIGLPLAVTGGAVAFLAGGVVSFLLAGSAQDDARATCPTRVSCDDERDKVRTLDTLALTGFVAGAGLGALAVVLWTGRSSAKVGVTASSVVVGGRF